jgi:hypothetical protein
LKEQNGEWVRVQAYITSEENGGWDVKRKHFHLHFFTISETEDKVLCYMKL